MNDGLLERLVLVVALAAPLAACGGGGGAHALTPAAVAPKHATVSATLVIPKPVTASSTRRAAYVSAATSTITFSVNGGPVQTFDASVNSPSCTAVAQGRSCSFTIALGAVTPGPQTIAVKTYSAPGDGTAQLLSENTETVTLAAGVSNVALPLILDGVPVSAAISVPAVPLTLGQNATVPVIVTVTDASGNTIIGNAPFDNNDALQISVQPAAGTLTVNPLNGSPSSAATVNVTSPSTTVTYQYAGGPVIDANLSAQLVVPGSSSVPAGTTSIAVQPASTTVLDEVTSVPAAGVRVVRGPDGDVYFLTGSGIGRIAFTNGVPAASACTVTASDFTISSADVAFIVTPSLVATFPASPFPSGSCGSTTRHVFTGTEGTGTGIAADNAGVIATAQGAFITPGSGNQNALAAFTPSGTFVGSNPTAIYSAIPLIPYGDPASSSALVQYTYNYGQFYGGDVLAGVATSPAGLVQIPPSAGDQYSGTGGLTFGFDPSGSREIVLDTLTINTMDATTPPVVFDQAGNPIGPALPTSVTAGEPVVAADGRIFVVSGTTLYAFESASGTWFPVTLTAPGGAQFSLTSAVLGADGRLWCLDSSYDHVFVYPGSGATL